MEIEFTSDPTTLSLDDLKPVPAKKVVPNWFKNVPPNTVEQMTIKGCMPVLDAINAGYILKLPQDMYVQYNFFDPEHKKRISKITFAKNVRHLREVSFGENDENLQDNESFHPAKQLDGDGQYMAKKNGLNAFFKIINPWTIKTPPGYSCLFIPPMHREFDYFEILPGVVDTDKFSPKINFPIIFNKYKYPSFKKMIKRGTPYVQVIPFKRDSWKMSIGEKKEDIKTIANFRTSILNWYKNYIRVKKEFN